MRHGYTKKSSDSTIEENAGIFSITEFTMRTSLTKYGLFSTAAQNIEEDR